MTKHIKKHVKIGDKIKVITGNQKGLIGTISSILTSKSSVIIDTVIPRIKYKKNPQGGASQKIDLQLPIHISNVMLWDSETNVASRIGYKEINNEKKRYFKKSGNFLKSN